MKQSIPSESVVGTVYSTLNSYKVENRSNFFEVKDVHFVACIPLVKGF